MNDLLSGLVGMQKCSPRITYRSVGSPNAPNTIKYLFSASDNETILRKYDLQLVIIKLTRVSYSQTLVLDIEKCSTQSKQSDSDQLI